MKIFLRCMFLLLLLPATVQGQDFKKTEAAIKEYKQWLDLLGAGGVRLWVRLDSTARPHRLYVGEAFDQIDYTWKEQFVETFSSYLAGHPEKFMLIDLFDGKTGAPIGEFGWGGFKLYPNNSAARNESRADK